LDVFYLEDAPTDSINIYKRGFEALGKRSSAVLYRNFRLLNNLADLRGAHSLEDRKELANLLRIRNNLANQVPAEVQKRGFEALGRK
jgi:hypothetical protein